MTYGKIKPQFDNRRRIDGSIFVKDELYTEKELLKFKVPSSFYEKVEISKRNVYFCFGARFA